MRLVESKARSKALFAVCHLEHNQKEITASDVADKTGHDNSNASRYCNEWHDKGVLYKDREGNKVTFGVRDFALIELFFDHIAEKIREELNMESFNDSLQSLDESDVEDVIENMGALGNVGRPVAENILDKRDMVMYFEKTQIDFEKPFAEDLDSILIRNLKQGCVSTMDTAQNVFEALKAQFGAETIEKLQAVMSLTKAFEEPVKNANTVQEAFDEIANQLCFRSAELKQNYHDPEMFFEHLKTFRSGSYLD